MIQTIPTPNPRELLPPLLACLYTASTSIHPPPSLLPLLSPILQQRVELLADKLSHSESWLRLLCWESSEAGRLVNSIRGKPFELHPVSGEFDFGDLQELLYRRLDEETLHARVTIPDLGLIVVYLWCEQARGGVGDDWKVSEVKTAEYFSADTSNAWSASIPQADVKWREKIARNGPSDVSSIPTIHEPHSAESGAIEDEEDAYWARYDFPPRRSPRPGPPERNQTDHTRTTQDASRTGPTTSDDEYYARYEKIQPEMENDDPSQDRKVLGESSLNGDAVVPTTDEVPPSPPYGSLRLSLRHTMSGSEAKPEDSLINHSPASSTSRASPTVARLEESAETISHGEMAIRQHVSTTIKSLFRLSRAAGMDRLEFDELVRTELDTLGLLEEDD